jgi:putative transposase
LSVLTGDASRFLFEEHLKQYFWKPYFWSRSYSLFSVGAKGAPIEVLLRYIQEQDAPDS